MNDPVSPNALSGFLDGLSDRLSGGDDWRVHEYFERVGLHMQAKLSRLRGEPTAMPPEPHPPDCPPEPTRPKEDILDDIADRAAHLGTEEDEKRPQHERTEGK
jgi:hypothetical protein